jgi:membrane protein
MRLPGRGMSWREFGKGLKDEVVKDGVTDLAGAVTYYGVLALFPFLLFLVALASAVITPEQADQLVRELSQVAPGAVTQIVGERVRQLGQQDDLTLLGFGALGALWAASGAILALMRALNITYDVKDRRPFWKVRGIALLMTIVASVLALVSALVAIAAEPVAAAVGGPVGTAILWLRLPVAGLVMMFLWACLYYALPDVEQEFKFITPGSVAGVLLWVVASWAFGKYVANFGSYDKTYGSIAGVIVLLLWMWISAVVLLVGAEVNALIEHRSPEGKREGSKSLSDRGTTPRATVTREPVPVGAAGAVEGGATGRGSLQGGAWSGVATAVPPRARRRPPLRGVVALASGFAAGVLLMRGREA